MCPEFKDRAYMLGKVRSFFAKRKVLEASCPLLLEKPNFDLNIEPIKTECGFLHTSPEYSMKRLLAENVGDIYFLGPVFRKNEKGRLHNPEFTMIEWYRQDISMIKFLKELFALVELFLGKIKVNKISYKEAFKRFAPNQEFTNDELLNLAIVELIEPNLKGAWLIYDYPASQSIFAKVEGDVAKRFELYFDGIELANGCEELSDAKEQRKRLEKFNAVDEPFLKALEKGIGNCIGAAIGFDRLFMLRHKKKSLQEILYFSKANL